MPRQISPSSVVCWSQNQVSSELDENIVLLNVQSGVYYNLECVAARVWTLMQQSRCVADICDTIVKEYEVEPERCEHDVICLLNKAARAELIEVQDGAA